MGKKARIKAQRRTFSSVEDANRLLAMARQIAAGDRLPPSDNPLKEVARQAGGVVSEMLKVWDTERIILRCDGDFSTALLATDRSTEVPTACFERFPFSAVMVSFPAPFDLFDGQDTCRYRGVLISGATSTTEVPPQVRHLAPRWDGELMWTTYGPVAKMEIVRFGWFFTFDSGQPGFQTYTLPWRGFLAEKEHTVAELVDILRQTQRTPTGFSKGLDADVLVPLSISLLLYLGSAEPDIDRPILVGGDGTNARHLTGAKVSNMGFRIGAALRAWDRGPSHSSKGAEQPTGRTVAPHIRSAHWHRFRVATRDAAGNMIGNRLGEKDVDWHYDLRWIPPVPVNVDEDEGPPVTVRNLED